MIGGYFPIWTVLLIEFCLAYLLELVMGSPCSFKLVSKVFNINETNPIIFETAIISVTVALMCPSMSLIASLLYFPYNEGFSILALLVNWLKLICFNFPFAFFSQLFFIQPFVRTVFRFLFVKKPLLKY